MQMQPPRKQRPLKVGFYLHKDHAEEVEKSLPELLANRGVDVKFVHCGGLWFDVIPLRAGKGEALIYLQQKFRSDGKLPINTLVCGDSGNDVEMFGVPDVYGVVVGNAREELPQWCAWNCKDHPNIIRAHRKVGRFNPVYERWRRADVENSDSIVQNMRSIAHPAGVVVHPSGVVRSLPESIDAFARCYGDKRGKQFRAWVDGVSSSQMGSDAWLVRFHKWELSDEGRRCCLTSILWNAKPEAPEEFALVHVHQTWLDGYAAEDQTAVIF